MVENSYGNGIVCSGPQMSISPFAYTNLNIKRPMDYIYETPYYNQAVDDDGNLTYLMFGMTDEGKVYHFGRYSKGIRPSKKREIGATEIIANILKEKSIEF